MITGATTQKRVLAAVLAAAFIAGVAFGGRLYATRDGTEVVHRPGTSEWPQHGVIAVFVVIVAVAAWRHAWSPRRLRLSPLRCLFAVPVLVLAAYLAFRAGVQVLAGLDPAFTANAWGGPSYLGAMACHYLDIAALAVPITLALRGLLTASMDQRAASAAS